MERNSLSVNLISHNNNKEWTRYFTNPKAAESYIRVVDNQDSYSVTEYNFTKKYSDEELDTWDALVAQLVKETRRLQEQSYSRTLRNLRNPEWNPCQVCGEKHPNYNCCDKCNSDDHICHFCGDNLGHDEVSICYILADWDE